MVGNYLQQAKPTVYAAAYYNLFSYATYVYNVATAADRPHGFTTRLLAQ